MDMFYCNFHLQIIARQFNAELQWAQDSLSFENVLSLTKIRMVNVTLQAFEGRG